MADAVSIVGFLLSVLALLMLIWAASQVGVLVASVIGVATIVMVCATILLLYGREA